jgi:CubicO group peptidase (beta-lactamase class C family)
MLNDEAPVEIIIPEVANPVIVEDVLSESPGYKPAQGKILVKHLLNHTSGLYLSKVGRATPDDLPPAYTSLPYKGNHTVAQFFTLVRVSVTFIQPQSITNLTLHETGWLSGSSSRL